MQNTEVLRIGPGSIDQIAFTLQANNISGKILYVSDLVVNKLYGDIVKKQLSKIGSYREELIDLNTISYAMSVAERVIATDIKCIVAVGGGKVLDVCKYASYISKCPLLSVATTMANDGIASPIAVLKRKDGKPKSLGCTTPSMLIVDTQIIKQGPLQLIKAGIGDTISNYTALIDWELAVSQGKESMNGYAYLMSKTSLDALMKTQYDSIEDGFIDVLANSLVLSGIAMKFAGSSRPVSGSEHLFSHALDFFGDKNILHGIQVALGTVTMLKLMGKNPTNVINYLNRFGVDINPKHLSIDEEAFIYCLQHATEMRPNRYTYLDEADLNEEKLRSIYFELTEELR